MGDFNVEEEKHLHFCEFPDDLIEEVLAYLQAEYLYRFSIVCKQWNTLFSSIGFITNQWALAPPNKKPWLVVGDVEDSRGHFSAYSLFTRNWNMPCLSLSSLSFLEGEVEPVFDGRWYVNSHPFSYLGSAAGLFLIGQVSTPFTYVCNPLTGNLLILPPMNFINCDNFKLRGIVQEGEHGYKVVALGYSPRHRQKIVEIYDSAEKEWTVAGFLSRYLRFSDKIMVFCEGFFYCLAEDNLDKLLVGFNMRDGTSFFVPLPTFRNIVYYIKLVLCGCRILLLVGISLPEFQRRMVYLEELNKRRPGAAGNMILWEFDKEAETRNWREIHRRRTTLFDGTCECVGMGDCVYLKESFRREIEVYSLTQNSWSFLPTCPTAGVGDVDRVPIEDIDVRPTFPVLTIFEPRPDMKVE